MDQPESVAVLDTGALSVCIDEHWDKIVSGSGIVICWKEERK